jgi:hypothetical protein
MNQITQNPFEIVKRIVLGVIGMASLLAGLYMVYVLIITLIYAITVPMPGGWWDNPFKWFGIMFIFLILALSVLYIALSLLLLAFAYPFLASAIKGSPLDGEFVRQVGSRLFSIIAPIIVMVVIGLIFAEYRTWDPHLGDYTVKDNYTFSLQYISATDKLYDCNVDTGSGWKFVVLRYYVNNTGKEPIGIWPGSIVDENGVSYSNYESECLPKDDYNGYDYSKDIPAQDYRFGNFAYRVPTNAIPAKLSVMVNGDFVTISLHKRQFLFF